MRSTRAQLGHAFLCFCMLVSQAGLLRAQSTTALILTAAPQQTADGALEQGRRLLRRGQGDQALSYLETALRLYTAPRNSRGVAASHNELGDLYLRQGQYKVALDHYQKAYQAFASVAEVMPPTRRRQTWLPALTSGWRQRLRAATETAAARSADNGFNANLMLAKIGDTNYRLGQMSEASTAYFQMNVKKPESAGAKVARRLGGLGAIGGASHRRYRRSANQQRGVGLLEAKKELDEYRVAIVYMTFELGMGRIAFANKDLETARKHFQKRSMPAAALCLVAKLGQTRRFRAAARTSLGDVALREGRFKDAAKVLRRCGQTAEER